MDAKKSALQPMLSKERALLVIVIDYKNLHASLRRGGEHDVKFFDTLWFGIGNAGGMQA